MKLFLLCLIVLALAKALGLVAGSRRENDTCPRRRSAARFASWICKVPLVIAFPYSFGLIVYENSARLNSVAIAVGTFLLEHPLEAQEINMATMFMGFMVGIAVTSRMVD